MERNNKGEQCATCLPLTLPSYILLHPALRPEADFHGLCLRLLCLPASSCCLVSEKPSKAIRRREESEGGMLLLVSFL